MKYQLQKDFARLQKWDILTADANWLWYNSKNMSWEHVDYFLALPEICKPIKENDWIDKVTTMLCEEKKNWDIDKQWVEDVREAITRFMPKVGITNKEISNMKDNNSLTVKTLLQLIESRGLLKD